MYKMGHLETIISNNHTYMNAYCEILFVGSSRSDKLTYGYRRQW